MLFWSVEIARVARVVEVAPVVLLLLPSDCVTDKPYSLQIEVTELRQKLRQKG